MYFFINFFNKKMIMEIWNWGIMVVSLKIYYMYKVFNIVSLYSLFKINLMKILVDIKDLKVMVLVGFFFYYI